MAYPPGMLVRKDGNIRFQYRIPKDLLQHYPRPIMSENLGTSDRALAARMIHARKAELERGFQRLRSQTAQVPVPRRATITDDEAATIARTMLAPAISADEELRHDGLIDAHSLAPELAPSMQSPAQEAVRLAASRGDYSAFTDVVDDWLHGHGYDLEPGSPDFRKVAREFAKATQQKLEIQRKRNGGKFVETPAAPEVRDDSSARMSQTDTPGLRQFVEHSLAITTAMRRCTRNIRQLLVYFLNSLEMSRCPLCGRSTLTTTSRCCADCPPVVG